MATHTRLAYIHDISTMADLDVNLGLYQNFYNVTISVEGTLLDAGDCTVGFLERVDSSADWKLLPGMTYALAGFPTDSQELTHGDFGSRYVGLRIAKGSCTAGKLSVYVTAKTED